MKQYVQHVSGVGEKWEVRDGVTSQDQWCVKAGGICTGYHWLPKSEYHLCEPPEKWVDVTEKCAAHPIYLPHSDSNTAYYLAYDGVQVRQNNGHRLRKVHVEHVQWAFIVEKKVSE